MINSVKATWNKKPSKAIYRSEDEEMLPGILYPSMLINTFPVTKIKRYFTKRN